MIEVDASTVPKANTCEMSCWTGLAMVGNQTHLAGGAIT